MAQVGVASDAEHILVNWPARSETSIALFAAQSEYASFQICVAGPCTVTNVRLPTFGPFGAGDIHVFTEWNINLFSATAPDGWTGPTPFIMVPIGNDDVVGESRNGLLPINVSSGQLQMFWVDMLVPAGAAPGTYSGTATVDFNGQASQTVGVTVTTYGFALPTTSSLRTWAASFYPAVIAQHIGMSDQTALNRLTARYSQLFLDHRYSLSGLDTGDSSLANWTANFSQFLSGTASTRLPGARWSSFTQHSSWGPPGSGIYGGSGSFIQNLITNGWLDRFFAYTVDEPSWNGTWWNTCPYNASWKSIDGRVKSLVTDSLDQATANGAQNCVDILCPVLHQLWPPGSGSQIGNYSSWKSQGSVGREVWTYQSNNMYQDGWLKYVADASALQMRQMGWMDYLSGVSGELFFSATYSMQNGGSAWNNIWAFNGNGGTWVFPGCATASPNGSPLIGGVTDIPLSSFLLKQIRQGLQEYEYGKLLDRYGDNTMRTLGMQMFPGVNTQPDKNTFLANRRTIGDRANQLAGSTPSLPAPSIDSVSPNVGPIGGGAQVTITGTGFADTDSVSFGTQAAAIVSSVDGTSHTVTAPPNPVGTVDITVANAAGAWFTLTNGFTYQTDLPAPPSSGGGSSALDPGYPVSATLANQVAHSITASAPPTVPSVSGARLVYAQLIWNTRGNTNASGGQMPPVVIKDSNGKVFARIVAGDFVTTYPYHQGAEIHAAWYTSPPQPGLTWTATWGAQGSGTLTIGPRAVSIPTAMPAGYVSVKDAAYGATGNGTTDDTAAIRAAASTGKPLWFPQGTYLISNYIDCIGALGQGGGAMPTITWPTQPPGSGTDDDGQYSILRLYGYQGASTIAVAGLHLRGSGATTGEHGHCIAVCGSSNVEIYGNLIENGVGDGVYIYLNWKAPTVYTPNNINIHDNTIQNNYRCSVAPLTCTNVTIKNNKLVKSSSFVTNIDLEPNAFADNLVRNTLIDSNVIQTPSQVCIQLYATVGSSGVDGTTIQNNQWSGSSFFLDYGATIGSPAQPATNTVQTNNVQAPGMPSGGSGTSDLTFDALMAVYSRYNTADGSTGVARCFSATATNVNETGTAGAMAVTLNTTSTTSVAIVCGQEGTSGTTITPLANTAIDVQHSPLTSMMAGHLTSATSTGGMTVGPDSNTTTAYDAGTMARVTDYGATGDGTTDDTTAIANAAATGKVLFFPKPSVCYKTTGFVALTNGAVGDGTMPTIRMTSPDGTWVDSVFRVYGQNSRTIVINGLTIDGGWNETATLGEHSHGVDIQSSSNVFVQNCVLNRFQGDCVYVGRQSSGSPNADRITIQKCLLHNPYRCDVAVVSGTNVLTQQNIIEKANTYVNPLDGEPNSNNFTVVNGWTITNNYFNLTTTRSAISFYDPALNTAGQCGNVSVTNNHGQWTNSSDTDAFSVASNHLTHFVSGSQPWANMTASGNTKGPMPSSGLQLGGANTSVAYYNSAAAEILTSGSGGGGGSSLPAPTISTVAPTTESCAGGDTVTANGTNLTNGSTVWLSVGSQGIPTQTTYVPAGTGGGGGSTALTPPLHTNGNQIVDSAGNLVRLTGHNMIGWETPAHVVDGVWQRTLDAIFSEFTNLGYNAIRLPYSNSVLSAWPTVYLADPDLAGKSSIDCLDVFMSKAANHKIMVFLDRHRYDDYNIPAHWYDGVGETQWINDWVMLANRYKSNPWMVGCDLTNEPSADQWSDLYQAYQRCGNAILAANPNLLIICEGAQTNPDNYGGGSYTYASANLTGVHYNPVVLNVPNRVVYSPHEYCPFNTSPPLGGGLSWMYDGSFPNNMPAVWDFYWGWIHNNNLAPIILGEFGGNVGGDWRGDAWYSAITNYVGQRGMNFTFWTWGPDSTDTGGLTSDWDGTVVQQKQNYLAPIQFQFASGGGSTNLPARLTFPSPAHSSGLVDVRIYNPDGQSATLVGGLTFTQTTNGSGSSGGGGGGEPPPLPITPGVKFVSLPGSGATLQRQRTLYRLQASVDPVTTRVQDQLLGQVNPALRALAAMPTASSGIFNAEAWTDLLLINKWTSLGSTPAGFYRDAAGRVSLRGVISGGNLSMIAAVLPKGYRPGHAFTLPTVNGTSQGSVRINPDGTVVPASGKTALGISLDGLTFRAEG